MQAHLPRADDGGGRRRTGDAVGRSPLLLKTADRGARLRTGYAIDGGRVPSNWLSEAAASERPARLLRLRCAGAAPWRQCPVSAAAWYSLVTLRSRVDPRPAVVLICAMICWRRGVTWFLNSSHVTLLDVLQRSEDRSHHSSQCSNLLHARTGPCAAEAGFRLPARRRTRAIPALTEYSGSVLRRW